MYVWDGGGELELKNPQEIQVCSVSSEGGGSGRVNEDIKQEAFPFVVQKIK